jgi:hypothetical protein
VIVVPATYEPIATQTLAIDTASVTFSSIPSIYTDLLIVASAQRAITGSGGAGTMRINGDTGSNYSSTILYNDGNTVYSFRWSNQTSFQAAFNSGDGSYAVNLIHIMNYANTTTNKTVLSRVGFPGTNSRVQAGVNLWRSTAAVDSITLTATSDIESGSTFTLYGIKAA